MEIGYLAIAVVVGAVLFGVGAIANRFFHDRIFVGLTPGLTPALGTTVPVAKVQPGREYSGEVAVAFSPPRGLKPGLVGTIVDGEAEMRDITATIVDLAVRGWLRIETVDQQPERVADPKRKARDWRVTPQHPVPANDRLDPFESRLLESLLSMPGAAEGVLMSAWTRARSGEIRGLQNDLYQQTVANGWYDNDPRSTSGGCLRTIGIVLLIGYCLLMFVSVFSLWTILAAAILVVAASFAGRRLKVRTPRTALGTAAMIQSLGFKKYLATAEAEQFSFEEAAGIFSRYLPYALVFGVADHWAKVFGDVAQASHDVGGPELLDTLIWMDFTSDLAFGGLSMLTDGGLDGLFDISDLADGLGGVAEGVGGFVEGVGDFISDLDFDL